MAKYKPKSKWQEQKEQKLSAVGISKFAFGLGLIISIGLTIYCCATVGFVEYREATATIITLDEWNDYYDFFSPRRGESQVGHHYTYRYMCEFIDDEGTSRYGIYSDSEKFLLWEDVEYQDGVDYENGDRVTIYYPSDFQDGDWVESRNPKKIAQTLLFIFWGATIGGYLIWRSDKQEYDRLYKRKG